jgi:hypothetical protein
MDTKELRKHLEAALACLDGSDVNDGEKPSVEPDDSDDMPMKSMKMSLSKYKV